MTKTGNSLPRPTESELELLRILWEKQPATVREIYDALNMERPSGYTTVLKLLQIMTAKGLVGRDEANRAHVYRSAISQDAMQSKILKDLSVRLFSGSAAQLALHALAMEPASDTELDEIRALLQKRTSLQTNGITEYAESRIRERKDSYCASYRLDADSLLLAGGRNRVDLSLPQLLHDAFLKQCAVCAGTLRVAAHARCVRCDIRL